MPIPNSLVRQPTVPRRQRRRHYGYDDGEETTVVMPPLRPLHSHELPMVLYLPLPFKPRRSKYLRCGSDDVIIIRPSLPIAGTMSAGSGHDTITGATLSFHNFHSPGDSVLRKGAQEDQTIHLFSDLTAAKADVVTRAARDGDCADWGLVLLDAWRLARKQEVFSFEGLAGRVRGLIDLEGKAAVGSVGFFTVGCFESDTVVGRIGLRSLRREVLLPRLWLLDFFKMEKRRIQRQLFGARFLT